jgi:hypothetical protein
MKRFPSARQIPSVFNCYSDDFELPDTLYRNTEKCKADALHIQLFSEEL